MLKTCLEKPGQTRRARALVLVCTAEMKLGLALCASLQERGVEICGPVSTSRAALRLLKKRRPDAALLDLELLDGVCASVAGKLAADGTPCWIISDLARPDELPPELRSGRWVNFDGSVDAIMSELERAIPRRSAYIDVVEMACACPSCGVVNTMTASRGLEWSEVLCSTCHGMLGRIGELAAGRAWKMK